MTTQTPNTDTLSMPGGVGWNMESQDGDTHWAGITQYLLDDDTIVSADAFRLSPETLEAERVTLDEDSRVGFREDVGIPDRFEYAGTAEDHTDDPSVWGVWATPDGDEWGATKLHGDNITSDYFPDFADDEPDDSEPNE